MTDILGLLLVPSGWIAALICLSIPLLLSSKLRRLGHRCLVTGALIYGVFGNGPAARVLLGPLEQAYPALLDLSTVREDDTIVVFTAYASRNQEMPPVDRLNGSSLYRLAHALWLARGQRDARLIFSGSRASAEVMGAVAGALGITDNRLLLDKDAKDTGASAEQMRSKLEGRGCVLVTSAGHMPRAMGVFRKQGIECLPAPVEFYTTYALGLFDYLPSPRNLVLSDLAVHEYLGLLWYRLQGRL